MFDASVLSLCRELLFFWAEGIRVCHVATSTVTPDARQEINFQEDGRCPRQLNSDPRAQFVKLVAGSKNFPKDSESEPSLTRSRSR